MVKFYIRRWNFNVIINLIKQIFLKICKGLVKALIPGRQNKLK